MKSCNRCGETFPANSFPPNGVVNGKQMRRPECWECRKTYNRDYVWKNKILKNHGLTEERYNQMLNEQSGGCAICGDEQPHMRLAVDHDHKTNEVRGLLCDRCNRGIGFMRDNPDLLIKAASYLMVHSLEKVGGGSNS